MPDEPLLPLDAGRAAVVHARAEAEAEVRRERGRPRATLPLLQVPRGAFVTLWHEGALRGCVGYAEARDPLQDVLALAARGAVRDPRLPPVRPSELDALLVEVSVLTPPRPLVVRDPRDLPERLRIGRDGLMLQAGRHRALLLPQVAVDHGLTAEAFLAACCAKAGLAEDAWRTRALAWQVFGAQVFQELRPRGGVEERRDEDRPELG